MSTMNRRDFMRTSAVAASVALAGVHVAAEPVHVVHAAAERRVLGRRGVSCTRLGVGTGTRAWNKNSAQIRRGREAFLETLVRAYEEGVRYFDLADMYGSHEYLRDAMAMADMKREEMFILTKATSKTAEEMSADLDRMLAEAGVDYFDSVLLHCMTSGNWPETMAPCMDVLSAARDAGRVKSVGVSCHHITALRAAAVHDWVDVILARINPFGTHMDGTEEEIAAVLREARTNGKGIVGMKILGEGKHVDEKEKCIRFAMGLEYLDAMTIGFLEARELEEIVALMDACAAG